MSAIDRKQFQAFLAELRRTTAQVREDLTPEFLGALTERELRTLVGDLQRFQAATRRLKARIEEHIDAGR